MQAVSATRPMKNRLFDLDTDLQMIIYSYSDSVFKDAYRYNEDDTANRIRYLFEETRQQDLYYDKLYFIGLYYSTVVALSNRNQLYCNYCEVRLPVASLRVLKGYYAYCGEECETIINDSYPRNPDRWFMQLMRNDRVGDYKNGIYTPDGRFISHDCGR
jgi:hypothetical protein